MAGLRGFGAEDGEESATPGELWLVGLGGLGAAATVLGGKSPAMGGGSRERGAAIGSSFHTTLSS